jgi:hypothetical protein
MTTGSEIAVRRPQSAAAAIPAKLAYAQELANSGLLPAAYRRNPANVLWAVEYGEMLGLPPMAAMTGVHVIEGKPGASAGLISALVRRGGHKLRVWGTSKSATCEIVRSDDPDHTFSVTWTLRKEADGNPSAEEAKLLGKDIWQKYPASMLKSRAITQCARDACEEVLFGLHYTPEELGAEVDEDGVVLAEVIPSAEGDAYAAGYRAAEDTAQEVHEAGDDPWYVRPAPEDAAAAAEWVAASLRLIPDIGLEACRNLWREAVEKVRSGEAPKAEAEKVLGALKVRMAALANPPQDATGTAPAETETAPPVAAVLDPADPWATAIEGMHSAADGDTLLQDVADQRGRGEMDPERADLIERAIEQAVARFAAAEAERAA